MKLIELIRLFGIRIKLKESAELDPFDSKNKNKNRLYVVRYLPRKFNGEKYFKTKKILISS